MATTDSPEHWTNTLVGTFLHGETTTVEIPVNPATDGSGMVTVASRIRGIYDALKNGRAGLADDDTEDLLRLADHLHRVIGYLSGAEDELLVELRSRGASSRAIASAWGVTDHKAVLRREQRVAAANALDINSHAYAERTHRPAGAGLYLVSRDPGVGYPPEAISLHYSRGGAQDAADAYNTRFGHSASDPYRATATYVNSRYQQEHPSTAPTEIQE